MNRSRLRPVLAVLLTVGALIAFPAATSAVTTAPPTSPQAAAPITPVMDCAALAGRKLPGATITSATVETNPQDAKGAPYCHVKGIAAPHTTFGLLLPTDTWHGDYVQEGCSGLCGFVQLEYYPQAGVTCSAVDDDELAYAADDSGHDSPSGGGQWAQDDLAARVTYGVTSEDDLVHVAQSVLTTYYGRPPAHSYFDGCSDGGRQALMLAQRFPDDFDGIIAGSPGMNMAPQFGLLSAWLARSNTGPDGHQIVTAEDLPALHNAVLRACGNAQGVITDPRRCAFDPASIQCPAGTASTSCLTPAQVAAVVKFYRGPTDQRGRSLYNGGEPYGSELGWDTAFVMPAADRAAPGDTLTAESALNYVNYLASWPNPAHPLTLADIPFTDAEFHELDRLGNLLYNANSPDLRAFAAHGGKLIVYHGWADQLIPPWSTVDYYRAVEQSAGGFRASQSFSRLYMIPGAYHCLIGPGGQTSTVADFLTPLLSWVRDGTPPAAVDAPTWSQAANGIVADETVQPYDALAPVTPAKGSLNTGYRYVGGY